MASFTVTNLLNSGAGSLRQAIVDANTLIGVDTIVFASDLSGVIDLTSGELLITDSVAINGPGANLLTIDAQQMSRVFTIDDGNDSNLLNVTLSGLTLTGGRVFNDVSDPSTVGGGGVLSHENLTIHDSLITSNSIDSVVASGGGVYSRYGNLTVDNSTISDNASRGSDGGFGGGVYHRDGNLIISNSRISDNSSSGDSSDGGGINSDGNLTTIENSAISGNSTDGRGANGGGVYSQDVSLTINNSILSGNSSRGFSASGGGIDSDGNLTINQSLLYSNSALGELAFGGGVDAYELTISNAILSGNSIDGTYVAEGGGIRVDSLLTMDRSIVANNIASSEFGDPSGSDIFVGSTGSVAGGDNLIGIGDNSGFIDGVNGNQVGSDTLVNPLFGFLQENSGLTQTSALLSDSSAIDSNVGRAGIGSIPQAPKAVPEPTSLISLALVITLLSCRLIKHRLV